MIFNNNKQVKPVTNGISWPEHHVSQRKPASAQSSGQVQYSKKQ